MVSPVNPVTTVLVIEDHPIYLNALVGYIEIQSEFEVIGTADGREAGLDQVSEKVPDIVLLDLGLPGVTENNPKVGLEMIREIANISPSTKIVVLTAFHSTDYIFRAIQTGATAYLFKEKVSAFEVVETLRRARDNEPLIDEEIAQKLWQHFKGEDMADHMEHDGLTRREVEVLGHISQGMSNADIARELTISVKTVKKHVSNILSKLHMQNRIELRLYYHSNYAHLDKLESNNTP